VAQALHEECLPGAIMDYSSADCGIIPAAYFQETSAWPRRRARSIAVSVWPGCEM